MIQFIGILKAASYFSRRGKQRPYEKSCPVGALLAAPLRRKDANTLFGAWFLMSQLFCG